MFGFSAATANADVNTTRSKGKMRIARECKRKRKAQAARVAEQSEGAPPSEHRGSDW
jgi:hypothetical protein